MIRHAIAAAAVLGLLIGMQPISASAQTSSSTTTSTQAKKPMAKKPMAKKSTAKKTMAKKPMAKKMASKSMKGSNRKLDNIADKLNACQAKPMGERQSCIDQATKS